MERSDGFLKSLTDDGRYRLLIEAVTDYAIYMLDPAGIVTSWNPGAQRFKGYAPDEIIGQHFSKFYSEEDRKAGLPARALETARREGKFENEGWRIRKDGTRFWAYVVIDPIRTPSSEVIGFAKITRDLTERREAELALRQSEEQFRLLVQGVTDYAIYLLDANGNVTNWNLGAQRIKGYLPHEIIGRHFYSSTRRRIGRPAGRTRWRRPRGRDGLKRKAGASARTAPASGRTSSSIPSATATGPFWATPRSPATSPSARKRSRNSKRPARHCSNPRRWMRSDS